MKIKGVIVQLDTRDRELRQIVDAEMTSMREDVRKIGAASEQGPMTELAVSARILGAEQRVGDLEAKVR